MSTPNATVLPLCSLRFFVATDFSLNDKSPAFAFANAGLKFGSGGRIRTDDLWVMSPTSCHLLHPASRQLNEYDKTVACPQVFF